MQSMKLRWHQNQASTDQGLDERRNYHTGHRIRNRSADSGWVSYFEEGYVVHYLRYIGSRISRFPPRKISCRVIRAGPFFLGALYCAKQSPYLLLTVAFLLSPSPPGPSRSPVCVMPQYCAAFCEGSAYFGTEYSNEVRRVLRQPWARGMF